MVPTHTGSCSLLGPPAVAGEPDVQQVANAATATPDAPIDGTARFHVKGMKPVGDGF